MIQEVDKPGSEITSYIDSLGDVLTQHISEINSLQSRLYSFRDKLKEEHRLNNICQSQQDATDGPHSDPDIDVPAEIDADFGDEPRARMTKIQSNYDYPQGRGPQYK